MRVAIIEGGKASMVSFASRRKKGSSTYDILVANFSNIRCTTVTVVFIGMPLSKLKSLMR